MDNKLRRIPITVKPAILFITCCRRRIQKFCGVKSVCAIVSLFFFWLAGFSWATAASVPDAFLLIGDAWQVMDLGPYIEFLEDPDGHLSIDLVSSAEFSDRFQKSDGSELNYGFTRSVYWVRCRLKNSAESKISRWLLESGYPAMDEISMYQRRPDGSWKVKTTGENYPIYTRDIQSANFVFSVDILPGEQQTFFFRFQTAGFMKIGLTLWQPSAYVEKIHHEQIRFGLFYGVVLVMAFYNLFLFFSVRDQVYCLYVIMALSYLSFLFLIDGQATAHLLPILSQWNNQYLIYGQGLMLICTLWFSKSFLNITSETRRLNRIFTATVVFVVLTISISVVFAHWFGGKAMLMAIFMTLAVVFLAGWARFRRGIRSARFFLLAFIILLTGGIVYLFRCLGMVPANFGTTYSPHIGISMQLLLLSFGLGDRINIDRMEKMLAREQAMKAQQDAIKAKALAVENLKKADRLKDEFLANTSHELRTPLNGIIGIAESLMDGATGPLPDKAQDQLAMIVSSGKRLAHLVNDILDFSKLRSKDIHLKRGSVDLRQLTSIVMTTLAPLAKPKQLKLENLVPQDLHYVFGDENRLHQIMSNLIGNAIKFTEQGRVCVDALEKDGVVEVSVSDTGIGIPDHALESIFKSFEQVDGSTAREYAGTGLGLSITKKLVELHGGAIWVRSKQGHGTTFTFTIPVIDEAMASDSHMNSDDDPMSLPDGLETVESVESVAEEPYEDEQLDIEPFRDSFDVLIVDDEPVNIQVITNYLSVYGLTPRTAQDGLEAMAAIDEKRPDLVLLDIMMPQLSGYEVCKRVRERFAPSELPVILLTAKTQVEDLIQGFESGANDYLTKPVAKGELIVRVKTHLELARLSQNLKKINLELEDYAQNLEQKVADRTQALAQVLEEMKRANENITNSIRYGRMIQTSLLPDPEMVSSVIPEGFFIWQPRDIVGGDMYHVERLPEGTLVTVMDCTGHGVPGAFMTLLASSALHTVIQDILPPDPARIISRLNVMVKTMLQQDTQFATSDDGLDMAVCFIPNPDHLEIYDAGSPVVIFSGARMGLFVYQENQLEVVKGDRMSLGYRRSDLDYNFNNHTLPITGDMVIYMTTDGVIDQIGGPRNRRFGSRRFRELLIQIAAMPMSHQQQRILDAIETYRGSYERVDDFTVVGFRPSSIQ